MGPLELSGFIGVLCGSDPVLSGLRRYVYICMYIRDIYMHSGPGVMVLQHHISLRLSDLEHYIFSYKICCYIHIVSHFQGKFEILHEKFNMLKFLFNS